MKTSESKEIKFVHKKVDSIMALINKAIPSDYTPYQVKAIFDLYISMYE